MKDGGTKWGRGVKKTQSAEVQACALPVFAVAAIPYQRIVDFNGVVPHRSGKVKIRRDEPRLRLAVRQRGWVLGAGTHEAIEHHTSIDRRRASRVQSSRPRSPSRVVPESDLQVVSYSRHDWAGYSLTSTHCGGSPLRRRATRRAGVHCFVVLFLLADEVVRCGEACDDALELPRLLRERPRRYPHLRGEDAGSAINVGGTPSPFQL